LWIGELGVLPKMRTAAPETLLAACGTSCRHRIAEGDIARMEEFTRVLATAAASPGDGPPGPAARGAGRSSRGRLTGLEEEPDASFRLVDPDLE
jgi:hypothetical protein